MFNSVFLFIMLLAFKHTHLISDFDVFPCIPLHLLSSCTFRAVFDKPPCPTSLNIVLYPSHWQPPPTVPRQKRLSRTTHYLHINNSWICFQTVAFTVTILVVKHTCTYRFWFYTTSSTKISNNLVWGYFCKVTPSGCWTTSTCRRFVSFGSYVTFSLDEKVCLRDDKKYCLCI